MAVAAERGVHVVDLALDLALATDLEARFRMAVMNTDEDVVAELLAPSRRPCSASPTPARTRASSATRASRPISSATGCARSACSRSRQAVRHLTSRPAEVFGIRDRGRLAPGLAADVTVFDPAHRRLLAAPPRARPAGGRRPAGIADAAGIRAVIVNGVVIREDGRDAVDAEGALPGRVLRGGQTS